MAVSQRDGSGTLLFLLAVLLFIIALVLAMFIAFKKGENLTKNDKLSIHRVYWTFLASFGFLFFAILVSYATANTSGSKKSCKYRYRSKHSNHDVSEHSSGDGDHDESECDDNHSNHDSYNSDNSHHSYSMKDYSTPSSN